MSCCLSFDLAQNKQIIFESSSPQLLLFCFVYCTVVVFSVQNTPMSRGGLSQGSPGGSQIQSGGWNLDAPELGANEQARAAPSKPRPVALLSSHPHLGWQRKLSPALLPQLAKAEAKPALVLSTGLLWVQCSGE